MKIPSWRFASFGNQLGIQQIFANRRLELLSDREAHAVVDLAELGNVLIRAFFLIAKIIGGDAHQQQALGFEALMELLQTFVLRREAALAGGVDDQDGFSLLGVKFAQIKGFAANERLHGIAG